MRTTRGKPTLDRRDQGDPELAGKLGDALTAEEREDRLTHRFHAYPASLHPEAARDLIALFPGESVLDPFCGGGTVLVESMAAGRRTLGRDVSPVAVRVARARTTVCDDERLTRLRSAARAMAAVAMKADTLPPPAVMEEVADWYAPYVLCELASLRRGIDKAPTDVQGLLAAAFSSILVKVSWRASETSARREEHPRPPGTASTLFHKKVRELARRLVALRDVVPEKTPHASIVIGDARRLALRRHVDLVLTSPPYPGIYDYLPMQGVRQAWFTGEVGEGELGSRRGWHEHGAQRAWRRDTYAWMSQVAQGLAPGGHLVVVIGDGLQPAGPVDALMPTLDVGEACGLEALAVSSLARPDHARDEQRWEHVIAFAAPTKRGTLVDPSRSRRA